MAATLATTGVAGASTSSAPTTQSDQSATSTQDTKVAAATPGVPLASAADGTATMTRVIDMKALQSAPPLTGKAPLPDRLGADGRSLSLPVRPSSGQKVEPIEPPADPDAPNVSTSAPAQAQDVVIKPQFVTPPTVVHANFDGSDQFTSGCGGCSPPNPSAAANATQIAETVNSQLQVYDKTGVLQCGTTLYSVVGPSSYRLADPRVIYDNLNNRFVLSFFRIPNATTDVPMYYVMTSTSADACGTWWFYTVTFGGPMFPSGTQVDFPYLGQDRGAVLVSSNNFDNVSGNPAYLNSAAWSMPKTLLYGGTSFSFPTFPVSYSSAPVGVAGIPIFTTSSSYFLASVPGTGYKLYRMTNTATTSPSMVLQATISAPFAGPSRRVNQPGTDRTLDPMDGRLVWQPVQDGNFVWFTHGVDLSGYPSVRYGAINTVTNRAYVATAYKSATSDDFNPSIGVTDAGFNTNYVFLNWSYTDTANTVSTSMVVNGVGPGQGVPSLHGGLDIVNGITTNGNFRFGDHSSVAIEPTASSSQCPAGRVAVVSNEYFRDVGIWQNRIARVGFC